MHFVKQGAKCPSLTESPKYDSSRWSFGELSPVVEKKVLFPSFRKIHFFSYWQILDFFSLFVQLTPSVAKNWPTYLVDLLLFYLFDCSRCSKWDWNAAICRESLTLKNPSSLIISPQIGCWKSGWRMRSMSIVHVMTWIVADYISITETKISMISIEYGACIGIAGSILISH